ncbi:MarR family winged helix-turn-helix transcriptional regulator [Maridesulfovibrio frigidus]|uniref:MarR family winged helix-turn-helix transcriptional regulator n=1 Tax=Maridesulfovibrio frigidus TaxID=340956 RepID=UPI0012EBADFA|nr:hypothetical protein [Maridesulfovibrio frigidus]
MEAILSEIIDEVHEKAGMRTSQIRLANTLLELGQTTVPDIAYTMKASRQFVQTVVNELKKKDIIKFLDNPRHKRSKLVKLTDNGQNILNQVRKNEEAIILRILPDIDATRVKSAYELLASIRRKITPEDT